MTINEVVTVADAVRIRLERSLLAGDYSAGARVKDSHVAQKLGVARPTARVAVQSLIAEGFLERETGQSARVRRFSVQDVADIFRVRRLIEFEAVRSVCQGANTEPIRESLARFSEVRDEQDWETAAQADMGFHAAVVEAAGSQRLSRLFQTISTEIRLLMALLRPRYLHVSTLHDEHTELLSALIAGNPDKALKLWAAHLDDAEAFLSTRTQEEVSREH
ncbi:DNA-binding GntR family transcriptional regulator [Arthrobacter pascens]|uniref:GntR family transcriptional regulator n=1 Tax=Arthrobacter pascens TaxID=1677 RepID=UPI00285BFDB7|nr:GntR family transcriptional regulator [Arthrobacter pascens]MDR6558529.1 DNA-binding GntR family transcriptional regulator [Arthrobacter pascens]